MESVIIVGIIGVFSVFYAAKGLGRDIAQVPWLELFLKTQYLGTSERNRHILWLFAWIAASCVTAFVLVTLLKFGDPITDIIYARLPIDLTGHPSWGGNAGLATLFIVTFLLYILIVKKAQQIVSNGLDRDPLFPSPGLIDPTKSIPHKIWRFLSRSYRFPVVILPYLLAPVYAHFYRSNGPIIDACARILLTRFGPDTINGFWVSAQTKSNDPRFAEIKKAARGHIPGESHHACIVLAGLVRIRGFFRLKSYINGYIQIRGSCETTERRESARREFPSPIVVTFQNGLNLIRGEILEYSSDGQGCFIEVEDGVNDRQDVGFALEETSLSGRVRHSEAYWCGKKIHPGVGVEFIGASLPLTRLL